MKKDEYIRQLKRLIKKYHPDLCNDENLEEIYNEITRKLVNILNGFKVNNKNNVNINNVNTEYKNNELIELNNQDYIYYKLGIKYYKNIHPNQFYKNNSNRKTFETKSYNELISVLNNIYLSFNLSEYYFNKIINDYPQSSFVEDSKDKIKLLNKLNKSYRNIIIEENKITNYEQFTHEMGLKIM